MCERQLLSVLFQGEENGLKLSRPWKWLSFQSAGIVRGRCPTPRNSSNHPGPTAFHHRRVLPIRGSQQTWGPRTCGRELSRAA